MGFECNGVSSFDLNIVEKLVTSALVSADHYLCWIQAILQLLRNGINTQTEE